jgi:hypothetical protein
MNETQILKAQLATERLHFAEVANACATALGNGSFATDCDFATACADYFAFAVTRFDAQPARDVAAKLEAARDGVPRATGAVGVGTADSLWREFLLVFAQESHKHFHALEGLRARNPLVTEWRAVSRIDADSIFAERARYGRVKATVPAGVALVASSSPPQ